MGHSLSQMQEPSAFTITAPSYELFACRWRSEDQTAAMAGHGQRMQPALASIAIVLVLQFMTLAAGEQCGRQAWGAQCPGAQCCSQYGWCGTSSAFCGNGCQSNCGGQGSNDGPSSPSSGTGKASFYTGPYVPSACYSYHQWGNMHFAAGGDSSSANIWNHGNNCGKTFRIQCQGLGCRGSGAITVKVVDRCPNGCAGGRAFDLSSEAFAAIADPDVGVITVTYSLA